MNGHRWKRCFRVCLVLLLITVYLFMLNQAALAGTGGVFPHFLWGGRYKGSRLTNLPFNDAFAHFYNPAFLPLADRQIGFDRLTSFGVPITALSWNMQSIGGYLVLNQTPEGLDFNYNTYQLGFTWAQQLGSSIIGVSPKLLYLGITDVEDRGDYHALGYGLDLGWAYSSKVDFMTFDRLSLNISATDILSKLHYSTGISEPGAQPLYSMGMGLKNDELTAGLVINYQEDDPVASIGFEYDLSGHISGYKKFLENLYLRLGLGTDSVISAGVGANLRGFEINYAIIYSQEDTTGTISTSIHF